MACYTFIVCGYKDGSDNVAWEYTFNTATETLAPTGNTWGIPRATTASCLGGAKRSDGSFIMSEFVGSSDARLYKVNSDLSGEDSTWNSGTGYLAINEIAYNVALDGDDNILIAHTTDANSDIVTHYSADGTTENWDYGVMNRGYGVGFDTSNGLAYWSGEDFNASIVNYANAADGSGVTSVFAGGASGTPYCRGLHIDNANGKVYIGYVDNVYYVAQYPVNSSTADWTASSSIIPPYCVGRCGGYVVAGGKRSATFQVGVETYLSSNGTVTDGYDIEDNVTDLLVLDSTYVVAVGNYCADEDANSGNVRVLKLSSGNISNVDTVNIGGSTLDMRGVIYVSGEETNVDLAGEATVSITVTGTLGSATVVELEGSAGITISAAGELEVVNILKSITVHMDPHQHLVCAANDAFYYEA